MQKIPCGTCPDLICVNVNGVAFVLIYRAPKIEIMPLLSWTPDGPTVVGGDFNALHPEWQPQANRQHGDGQLILEWMSENGMSLASRPGVPTHRHGNKIDLVLSNIGGLADVAPELHTSDHFTLVKDVPQPSSRGTAAIRMARPMQVKENAIEDFSRVMEEWAKDLKHRIISSAHDVDELADDLVQLFGDAIKATGRRDTVKTGRSAP